MSKLYIRQIRPYVIIFPHEPKYNLGGHFVDGYDWVSEDLEEEIRANIAFEDSWHILIFKERYVPINDVIKNSMQNNYTESIIEEVVDKFNSIGCTSFNLTSDNLKMLGLRE